MINKMVNYRRAAKRLRRVAWVCAGLTASLFLAVVFLPETLLAQSISVDLGEDAGSATGQVLRLLLFLTILSLAPSILIMVTSFTRIIVVFSLLRSAIGIQQTPPNSVLISLALFLTLFVMAPVFQQSYDQGFAPLLAGEMEDMEALSAMAAPFHAFMVKHVRPEDVALFQELAADAQMEVPLLNEPEALPYRVLIPAFMISELRRAFEIGFLVFVPFLIIDMMVASTLMSMGMMMLPPVLISLPFKLIFFVLIDGWHVLSESLVRSFS